MIQRYLLEYAESAQLALELARKEAGHLAYTHRTLLDQTIDLSWVESLSHRDDLSEKIDAFVSRFGRLQDHIGEKLIPRIAALVGEAPKAMIDTRWRLRKKWAGLRMQRGFSVPAKSGICWSSSI